MDSNFRKENNLHLLGPQLLHIQSSLYPYFFSRLSHYLHPKTNAFSPSPLQIKPPSPRPHPILAFIMALLPSVITTTSSFYPSGFYINLLQSSPFKSIYIYIYTHTHILKFPSTLHLISPSSSLALVSPAALLKHISTLLFCTPHLPHLLLLVSTLSAEIVSLSFPEHTYVLCP